MDLMPGPRPANAAANAGDSVMTASGSPNISPLLVPVLHDVCVCLSAQIIAHPNCAFVHYSIQLHWV